MDKILTKDTRKLYLFHPHKDRKRALKERVSNHASSFFCIDQTLILSSLYHLRALQR